MYKQHFGLRDFPFGMTPDTTFSYASTYFQQALNTLLVAADNGEGFIKITGEVGTGKTLLCRQFLKSLNGTFVSAYIPNPYVEPRTLLLALADELGIVLDPSTDQHHLLKALNAALLDFAAREQRVIVCLDEAQAMPLESLETLRLLSNLETEKRKLLQVVLFGQPELDEKLDNDSVRQLKQRITFQYRMGALTRAEADDYVAHRLLVAGAPGGRIFTRPALRTLFAASRGVPRLINIIAHKAMLVAFGEGKRKVTTRHLRFAVRDTPQAFAGARRWWWALGVACLCSIGAGWALLR